MTNDKCPYCGNNLEHGSFRSKGGNFFLPKGEKAPFLYSENSMTKRNAILLPPDILYGNYPDAYVCRTCKIIIIPY